MAGYPLGTSTMSYIYSHAAIDCLDFLSKQGFRRYELCIFPPHFWPAEKTATERRDFFRQVQDRGLTITSLCFPLNDNNMNSVLPEIRKTTLEMYKQVIDLAGEWKIPYVLVLPGAVHAYFRPPFEWLLEWFAQGLRVLADQAQSVGTQLLVENVQYTFLPTVKHIVEALDKIGDKRVGMNYDVGNAIIAGCNPPEDLRLMMDRIKLVHLADVAMPDIRKVAIGKGKIDFKAIADTFRSINYSGPSMLEIVTDQDRSEKFATSIVALKKMGWDLTA